MGECLLEANVIYYKYTCESCGNPIYRDYECMDNCPHCGNACGEKTKDNSEEIRDTIYYDIDPKTGNISLYEE